MAEHQRVHPVQGRDASLDVIAGVDAGGGVDRLAVDVGPVLGQRLRAAVNGRAQAIKDAAQHLCGHGQPHRPAQEANVRILNGEAGGAGKDLDDGDPRADLQHAAPAKPPLRVHDLGHLVVADVADPFDDDDGAFNAGHSRNLLSSIIFHHE